jgi:hypothetical protein
MRKLCLLGLMVLAGCQGVNGPFKRNPFAKVDDPRLSIQEQQRYARDNLALPDESSRLGEGSARPGTLQRP